MGFEDELGLPTPEVDDPTNPMSENYEGPDEPYGGEVQPEPVDEAIEPEPVEEAVEPVADDEVAAETPDEVVADDATPDDQENVAPEEPVAGFQSIEEAAAAVAAADERARINQAEFTRRSQERAETLRENEALRAAMAAMQQQVDTLTQTQLQTLAETDPERAAQIQAKQQFDAAVQQAVQAQVGQVQTQQQQWQAAQEAQGRVNEFYSRHPDAQGQEPIIASVMSEFSQMVVKPGDEPGDWAIDTNDPDALDIAYEISRDPTLRNRLVNLDLAPTMRGIDVARAVGDDAKLAAAIRANPNVAFDDETLAVTRQMLMGPDVVSATSEAQAAQEAADAAALAKAMVEPGHAQTSSPSAPGDEVDDIIAEYEKEAKSVLNF